MEYSSNKTDSLRSSSLQTLNYSQSTDNQSSIYHNENTSSSTDSNSTKYDDQAQSLGSNKSSLYLLNQETVNSLCSQTNMEPNCEDDLKKSTSTI